MSYLTKKNSKIVATGGFLTLVECIKFVFGLGFALDTKGSSQSTFLRSPNWLGRRYTLHTSLFLKDLVVMFSVPQVLSVTLKLCSVGVALGLQRSCASLP